MAENITMGADGALHVPDEPIIPFIEGDGTGVDIWPAAKLVLDAAAAKAGKTVAWTEVLAGEKAFNETGDWLPDDDRRVVPHPPDRYQGPAHDADRRRLPAASTSRCASCSTSTSACARCGGSRACRRPSSAPTSSTW